MAAETSGEPNLLCRSDFEDSTTLLPVKRPIENSKSSHASVKKSKLSSYGVDDDDDDDDDDGDDDDIPFSAMVKKTAESADKSLSILKKFVDKELALVEKSVEECQRKRQVEEQRLQSLEGDIEECTIELENKRKQVSCIRKINEVYKKLQTKIEECVLDFVTNETLHSLMEDLVRERELQLKTKEVEIHQLMHNTNKERDGKEEELEVLFQKIVQCTEELKTKEEELDAIKKLIDGQEKELESEREKLHKVLSTRAFQCAQIKDFESKRKQLEGQLEELKLKEKQLKGQERELESKNKHFDSLEKELKSKKKQLDGQVKEFKLKEKKFKGLVKKLESKKNHFNNLSKELKSKEQQLDSQLEELVLKEKQLKGQVKDFESKEEEFVEQVKDVESKKKHFESLMEELKSKEKQLEGRVEELESKEKQLRDQVKEFESKSEKFVEQVKDVESKNKHFESLMEEVKSKEKRLEGLEEEFELKEKQLSDQVKEFESKVEEFVEQVKDVESKKKHFESLMEEFKLKEKQLEGRVEELGLKEKQLKDQVKEFESKEEEFIEQVKDVESKNKHFESLREELKSKEKQLEGQLKELESKETQLEDRVKEFELKMEEFESQVKELRSKETREKQHEVLVKSIKEENELDEPESIGNNILAYLKTTSDPSKVVLDIIQKPIVPRFKNEDGAVIVDSSHIFLLEQLLRISPHIEPGVRGEAMKLALDLKDNMRTSSKNSLEVLGFLLLLSIYGLVPFFDEEEVLKLFEFAGKSSDFIQNLVKKRLYIEAVRFICAFKLADKNQPVDLLRKYMQDKTRDQEIATLTNVLLCISDHNLETEGLLNEIQDCIIELNRQKSTSVYNGTWAILKMCNNLRKRNMVKKTR